MQTKSKVVISPLPSWGARIGRNGHITPTLSGLPQQQEQNQRWLHHPCLLGGPESGGMATQPLHSHGSPNTGNKIKSGYITPAFLGARNRREWLHNPYIVGGLPTIGRKSEVATAPLPSWVPRIGRNGYITPALSRVPQQWGQNQKWLHHPCFLGARNWAEWLHKPHLLRGPRPMGTKSEHATSPLPSGGARNWAEWLRNPCLLGGSPTMGTKLEGATSPLLSRGPKLGGMATQPLPSRGSPQKGNKIRSGYITPLVPKAGTPQSSYTANSILGTVRKGTICGGKRPKKVRIATKIGERGCIGVCIT